MTVINMILRLTIFICFFKELFGVTFFIVIHGYYKS